MLPEAVARMMSSSYLRPVRDFRASVADGRAPPLKKPGILMLGPVKLGTSVSKHD